MRVHSLLRSLPEYRAMVLSTERAVEAIRTHGLGLADAAEGNFAADVVCCPGWNVSDLVWHVRRVHYFWASIVA
ncbi:MAG TPA: maleylpyruvate isomerase N-terminal domain-containing protein, partial [Acidimicrobiia bacterium]|nr:maleylpyruvate isomerase N-terminal domain-containing protein [Acidimicrobiia bacterium]